MEVELRDWHGRSLAKRDKVVTIQQYKIFVDGHCIGYVGWKPGASIQLIERVSPQTKKEISQRVAELKNEKTPPKANMPPQVPDRFYQQPEDEGITLDDIDEG